MRSNTSVAKSSQNVDEQGKNLPKHCANGLNKKFGVSSSSKQFISEQVVSAPSEQVVSAFFQTFNIDNITHTHTNTRTNTSTARLRATLIFGPTAVGKTDFLWHFHRHFHTRAMPIPIEVISADSRQVYRGFDIVSAYPPQELMACIPHHLIGTKYYDETYTVYDFVEDSIALIEQISARGHHALVVGGAAFYLYNLWKGLPNTPAQDPVLRKGLQARMQTEGLAALYAELQNVDCAYAEKIESNDSYRILRALEVYMQTGQPLSTHTRNNTRSDNIDFRVCGLYRPRAELYARINARVDAMIAQGLVDEVRARWQDSMDKNPRETREDMPSDLPKDMPSEVRDEVRSEASGILYPALRTIGMQEFLNKPIVCNAWAKGECIPQNLLALIVDEIKKNSRRYAKRQYTFFKKFDRVEWCNLSTGDEVEQYLAGSIERKKHKEEFLCDFSNENQLFEEILAHIG